ncbi:hypothetical protein NDU88_003036 [Pleurodeles waltl]|uniref:Uncharacterized protein n=1 Tax=Pleurodeles waltl TaxID=8319 RepID=A0AAV7LHC4_PLEWA|nr:hypothetical protein NDU88_003036 [Pleurodeles waltl]
MATDCGPTRFTAQGQASPPEPTLDSLVLIDRLGCGAQGATTLIVRPCAATRRLAPPMCVGSGRSTNLLGPQDRGVQIQGLLQGGLFPQGRLPVYCAPPPPSGTAGSRSPSPAPRQGLQAGASVRAGQQNPPGTHTVRARCPGHSPPPAGPPISASQRSAWQPVKAPGARGSRQRERYAAGQEAIGHRLSSSSGVFSSAGPPRGPRGSAAITEPSALRPLSTPDVMGRPARARSSALQGTAPTKNRFHTLSLEEVD